MKKKNKLYLECYSGISGDMVVAALLDLGADEEVLKRVLDSVPVPGFRVEISRVKKAGLDVCDFQVILDEAHENHDHDMEYLFGQEEHGHHHEAHEHHHEEHGHHHDGHEHHHEEHGHHHGHEHRGLREVMEIIEQTRMTSHAKEITVRIFTILAEAEAKAHGTTLEQVHFHEVGAVDSIVDIIAAAVCLDQLCITETVIPVLYEGCGQIRCQHGMLPVPVPAVMNIMQEHGLILHATKRRGELVTPTGAAIAAAICTSNHLPEQFRIIKTGMGAGKRAYEVPSILRAMLIEESENLAEKDTIWKLETNIDDCSGECLGYVMDRLMKAGARDVHFTPVYMKKNRPAYQLNVLCKEEQIKTMEEILFRETTTIGIRRVRMDRTILKRKSREIETSCGKAYVKVCESDGETRVYPEYQSVSELAEKSGKSYSEMYQIIQEEGHGRI